MSAEAPATPRPFRFGATTHGAPNARRWRRLARKVESLGFDTLQVSDHIAGGLSPLPALAAAAAATSTVRLGTLVLANDLRNPVVAAKELATVDVLSEGRLEWGVGAGWVPADYELTGIPMDGGAQRVARLREAVATVKGRFAEGAPEPVQRPHPPLLVAGAQRGVLSLAARQADIVGIAPSLLGRPIMGNPPTMSPEAAVDLQVGWLRAAAPERFDALERHVVAFPAIVTDDALGTAEQVSSSTGIPAADLLVSPHALIGTVDAICDALVERRERWGISYVSVPAGSVEALAPVVERLRGR